MSVRDYLLYVEYIWVIWVLPIGRRRKTLTMLHGKLERGPEEVVPREVVLSAPPSKYFINYKYKLCCFWFYLIYSRIVSA